jgi:hypothetical protein
MKSRTIDRQLGSFKGKHWVGRCEYRIAEQANKSAIAIAMTKTSDFDHKAAEQMAYRLCTFIMEVVEVKGVNLINDFRHEHHVDNAISLIYGRGSLASTVTINMGITLKKIDGMILVHSINVSRRD